MAAAGARQAVLPAAAPGRLCETAARRNATVTSFYSAVHYLLKLVGRTLLRDILSDAIGWGGGWLGDVVAWKGHPMICLIDFMVLWDN